MVNCRGERYLLAEKPVCESDMLPRNMCIYICAPSIYTIISYYEIKLSIKR